jgi:UTP--glucose-1-phosphate uridylyltransferase
MDIRRSDNMIRKVVIPAAGLGSRLFPATKEQPKEMLPIFSKLSDGSLGVKPLLQTVFEQLYDIGFREFCCVVGRDKRGIEDHFTADFNSLYMLKRKGRNSQVLDMNILYDKLKNSTLVWINQPEPRGFGDAVLMSRPFVQKEPFLVHAGDTYIISEKVEHISNLTNIHESHNADASFLVQKVNNPRQYGVVEGKREKDGIYKVERVVEKPAKPATNIAIIAIYAFSPVILDALSKVKPGKNGEIQLTDAIQILIEQERNVYGILINPDQVYLDIGSPETYWGALFQTYKYFSKKARKQ